MTEWCSTCLTELDVDRFCSVCGRVEPALPNLFRAVFAEVNPTVDELERERYGHGAKVEEPPQDVFFGTDPGLALVNADMDAWLKAHPNDDGRD